MVKINEHELVQQLIEARAKVELLENQLALAEKIETDAELNLIAYLENQDLRGFQSDQLNVEVEKKESLKVSIPEEVKDDAFTYIDEELGRGDAIKTVKQIHWKTLASLIGGRIKKGEPVPLELFKSYWHKSIDIKPLINSGRQTVN